MLGVIMKGSLQFSFLAEQTRRKYLETNTELPRNVREHKEEIRRKRLLKVNRRENSKSFMKS